MNISIPARERAFVERHVSPDDNQINAMLQAIGVSSLDELIDQTIPKSIRLAKDLDLPEAKGEYEFLTSFKKQMAQNKISKNYIGTGYYGTLTPSVILRNILENPGWYTAYTPYQAEIAQGRLEALINYQTMVIELTGMEVANASLLDEGTAAAEAISLLYGKRPRSKKKAERFFVDKNVFPQTLDVIKTRTLSVGIDLQIGSLEELDFADESLFGIYVQYPNNDGAIIDIKSVINKAKENDVLVAVGADLLSLTLLTPPGEMGADAVVGTTQRFGIPMGYGGPHAAYFATTEKFKRQIPGRIIGRSIDAHGNPAYRMALQTREQHIRREKATSNICTAQVLLAVMAGMYSVYHGPTGLKKIAERITGYTTMLDKQLKRLGFEQVNTYYFDTLKVKVNHLEKFKMIAESKDMNFRYFADDNYVGISLDETTTTEELEDIIRIFAIHGGSGVIDLAWLHESDIQVELNWPQELVRTSSYLQHEVYSKHHSEHEMLRYIKRLENKDLSLAHSMISLGSCTMKLNATTEMIPVTWPEMGQIHPFVPVEQAVGYTQMIDELSAWLCEITGFDGMSLQPNSGAQGEYAGLMVIKAYHEDRGEHHRNITLIPSSAHGTNPASAVMAGMKVVIVNCDDKGNIDVQDLKEKAALHKDNLSALMVTYPSTHGVFEEEIKEICDTIHQCGGQVYMDGANMNAQVGLTSPAMIGADVCHLNLHKTFCIPHGGGGPGVGPIGVAAHLSPFLPGNPHIKCGGDRAITAISSAPFGSASILAISYAYIAMMGADGLKKATQAAILNANYIKARLEKHYKVLYTNDKGRCAHEMIIDCRDYKKSGIEVADMAKRLMDYGFHAPTVSFPVAGTMMIEPTESETKDEMDRFCDAMIEIKKEIDEVISGKASETDNVLVNAPHTFGIATADEWTAPYSRSKAIFPLPYVKANKFWPSVGRIDNAHGDRNLICTCAPIEAYQETEKTV